MSNDHKQISHRFFLETDDGRFVSVSHLQQTVDPDLIQQTIGPIKRAIKEAIGGLGPIVGRDRLIAWTDEIIAEDFDSDGPQTLTPHEYDEQNGGVQ
jgi:hypothetical protein